MQIYVDIPEDPKFGAEEACKSLEDVGVLIIPQATFRYTCTYDILHCYNHVIPHRIR